MGSTSSKAARTLPKTPRAPPAWAGARSPSQLQGSAEHPPPTGHALPRASETKDAAIEQDARDPHFMANLSKLGPVKVNHHMSAARPAMNDATRLHETRLRSEDEARTSRTTRNRLLAWSLVDLLEERKSVRNGAEAAALAERYGIDADKMARLAQYVNSVSVHPSAVKRTMRDDGTESVEMPASWVSPRL